MHSRILVWKMMFQTFLKKQLYDKQQKKKMKKNVKAKLKISCDK